MDTGTGIVRQKAAIISELANRMKLKNFSFGKTALQKIIYLLQTIYKVPCGYVFEFYTYGPFSSELLSDLDYVDALGGVKVGYYGPMGYQIDPGIEYESIRATASGFLSEYDGKISNAIAEFGNKYAKDLELISTIVFCDRNVNEPNKTKFVGIVKALKPKFDVAEIISAIEELEDKKYIDVRASCSL